MKVKKQKVKKQKVKKVKGKTKKGQTNNLRQMIIQHDHQREARRVMRADHLSVGKTYEGKRRLRRRAKIFFEYVIFCLYIKKVYACFIQNIPNSNNECFDFCGK